jgi:CDP-paratose 2-epimerase
VRGDVCDRDVVRDALRGVDRVFHFAAQVAVTTSVESPVRDFDVNLRGTLGVLEEIRRRATPPAILFTSTNKVYGDLRDLEIRTVGNRCEPCDDAIAANGISESRSLQFCSPYGCSKGGADQYVLDYAKSYGLRTTVFRMSCIYGPHQWGNEDQGWVAHFVIKALAGEPITLYGNGKQVRDILFVEDLLNAMELAMNHVDTVSGQAFNIGGGPANSVSLLQLLSLIAKLRGVSPDVQFGPTRIGDQAYYVSDISRFRTATGWTPRVNVRAGVGRLLAWLQERQPVSVADAV